MQFPTLICVLLTISWQIDALENGLARTPPMGWMHWERYRCITDCKKYPEECISEDLFKRTTDLLVSEGYADAGYKYVIIDDCWLEEERDSKTNKLVPNKERFPSGLNALADYIHKKGLLFGLCEDFGNYTCNGYPGVINNMALDAQTFADWDVDYVKLDACFAKLDDMKEGFPEFGRLLNKTGRPMVYSCSWPAYQEENGEMPDYESLKQHCNLWRNWDDIDDSYSSVTSIMDYFSKNQNSIQPQAGPGHWNDPDMLILGNYGLSYDQSKQQMAVWAIMAAPLIMSNDLRVVRPEIKEILQNADLIAVNQDVNGIQGKRISAKDSIEVWTRPVSPLSSDGHFSYAVAFVSRRADGAPYAFNFSLEDLKLPYPRSYQVKDIFSEKIINNHTELSGTFETRVNPNGANFYLFKVLDYNVKCGL